MGKINILHSVSKCMCGKADFILNKNKSVTFSVSILQKFSAASCCFYLVYISLKQNLFLELFLKYREYSSETKVNKIALFTVTLCMDFCELN